MRKGEFSQKRGWLLVLALSAILYFAIWGIQDALSPLPQWVDEHGWVITVPFIVVLALVLIVGAVEKWKKVTVGGICLGLYIPIIAGLVLPMSAPFLAGGLLYLFWRPFSALARTADISMWLTCGRLTPGGNIIFYGSQAHFIAARILIAIGLAITIIAFIQIVRGIRNKELVTDGLYATVRHPQHLGIVIWTFGFAFWNSRPIDFIAWFIVTYGFLMLALSEERKLTEDFREIYTAYQGSVPFMIPFVNKGIKIPGYGWKRIATLVAIFIAGIICVPLIVKLIGVTLFY